MTMVGCSLQALVLVFLVAAVTNPGGASAVWHCESLVVSALQRWRKEHSGRGDTPLALVDQGPTKAMP
jgi:hypothetical protein